MNNAIHIIGGRWKGRKLSVTDQEGLRPTLGRVRETLFNWLMLDIAGACCLDAFAGTGALGLEALSRGAANVVLVEQHGDSAQCLEKNLQALKSTQHEVIHSDIFQYLKQARSAFDIIFLDPPFRQGLLPRALSALKEQECLAPQGLIYFEAELELKDNWLSSDWKLIKHQKAGKTQYGLIERS